MIHPAVRGRIIINSTHLFLALDILECSFPNADKRHLTREHLCSVMAQTIDDFVFFRKVKTLFADFRYFQP